MNKTLRFIISAVLIAALVFSSFVFANAAVVVTDEAGLRNALAGDATTIQINGTINLTSPLNIERTVTFVGGTIVQNRTGSTDATKEQVNALGGTVTFKGTKLTVVSGTKAPGITIGGSTVVVLDGATLEAEKNDTIYLKNDFTGMLNIIGNSKILAGENNAFNSAYGSVGVVNFVSGTIENTSGVTIRFQGSGAFNIGGVKGQTATLNLNGTGIQFDNGQTSVNVYDGAVINSNGESAFDLYISENSDYGRSSVHIYGGTFNASEYLVLARRTGNFNIFGGNFTFGSFIKYIDNQSPKIFVSGGNFTATSSNIYNMTGTGSPSINFVGGTYNFDPSDYVATNYGVTSSAGKYTVAANPGTPTVVSTSADFINAVDNGDSYIKLGASFTLDAHAVLDSDVYIDGNGYQITGGSQLQVNGTGNTVTLKNIKYSRGTDAIAVSGSPNLIVSGGEITCTNTGSGNEGTFFLADKCRATIMFTDDAVIKSSNWSVYTAQNDKQGGAVISLLDCTVQKTSGGSQTKLINMRSNATLTIGGGAEGQEAILTSGLGHMVYNQGSTFFKTNILDGAKITATGENYGVVANTQGYINIFGGTIEANTGYTAVPDDPNGKIFIGGGTFTSKSNTCTVMKWNGQLIVTGGKFSNTGSGAIFKPTKTSSGVNNGTLFIDGDNLTIGTDSVLLNFDGPCSAILNDVVINQTNTVIDITANGGDVTLNNCQITSDADTIVSESTAAINLSCGTAVAATTGDAIIGSATVNKDASSSINGEIGGGEPGGEPGGGEPGGGESGGGEPGGEPDSGEDEPLPENATLEEIIAHAKAGDTITIDKAYTKVPAITIDKNLTFDGTGSIAFANTGFDIAANVNVTFNGDIKVTMGADDAGGSNRLINLDGGATLTINGGSFTGYIRQAGSSNSTYSRVTINDGTFSQKNFRISEVSNGYCELVINGGKFIGNGSEPFLRINDSTAKMTILGGEFNHSGSGAVLLVGNVKELVIGDLATGKGPEMTNSNSGRIIDFNTGSGIESSSAKVNINAGVFTQTGSGYNIYFNKKANATININGGIFTTQSLATVYVNDSNVKDLRINGGTFETKTVSEQTVWKRNGAITITGGKFIGNGSYGIIGSANGTNVGALTIDGTNNPDKIVIEHRGTGAFIEHNAQVELKIINANLALVGDGSLVKIAGTSSKAITITKSNLSASNAALSIADETWTDAKSTITVSNSTISSYLGSAVVNPKNWPINKDANSKFVDNALGNHTHTPEWTFNDEYHWQVCSNPFCGVAVSERVKHTAQGGDCQHTKYCSDPNCGQPFGGNNYDIHVNPDGPFTYEENADGTTHTKYYTCCNTKAKTDEKHTFDSNGYCKYCDAYQVYGFKTAADTKQVIGEGQEITFTSVADFSKFVGVRVNGKTLVAGTDYVAVSGSTKITLKASFVKTLMVGVHTIEIISTDGTATTTFGIEVAGSENEIPFIEETTKPGSSSKPSTDKKPSDSDTSDTNDTTTPDAGNSGNGGSNNVGTSDATGDFNNLLLLFALLFVSGAAVVATLIYGKKSKVR